MSGRSACVSNWLRTIATLPSSGGAGEYTGGNGIVRRLRFLEPMTVTVLSSHRKVAPHGAAGGGNASVGENSVERADGHINELKGNDEAQLAVGDVFVMKTPGGGGYGKVVSDRKCGSRN
ncbi:MAG: hydantoinase B/oxoprolinase family protein [Paracoccaceae bacterium]